MTKSIAAGVLMMAALMLPIERLGSPAADLSLLQLTAPVLALLFLALTTGLLVLDLKRPDRFLYVLFRSNRRSWLVRGSWILLAYGGVAAIWLLGARQGDGTLGRMDSHRFRRRRERLARYRPQ
jgi:formate-dependent nitrite reductase membrane component NrfD